MLMPVPSVINRVLLHFHIIFQKRIKNLDDQKSHIVPTLSPPFPPPPSPSPTSPSPLPPPSPLPLVFMSIVQLLVATR